MKAAVLEEIGKPLRVIDTGIIPQELTRGHVLVRMLCSGICGAQLQEIDGSKGDPSHCPHFLGHEGCGIVEAIGLSMGCNGVNVIPGDKVVVHWRKGVGLDPDPPIFGDIKSGPCTTFSSKTVVSQNRVTPIPDDVPNDLAALLGCCLSTALATMENVAKINGGESVLVIGCGGVGLAMILAAKAFGAGKVVGTDREYGKWKLARSVGADRFFPAYTQFHWHDFSNNTVWMAEEPRPWPKYDIIINTVSDNDRDYLLKDGGRYIRLTGAYKNTEGGDFYPTRDIPRYIQMWRDGKLNGWENIITHRIGLDQINDGITAMRKGQAGRVMIEF